MDKTPLEQFRDFFIARVKAQVENHISCLGLQVRYIEAGRAGLDLQPKPELAGDPNTGVVAGGPLTALLDSCCAVAAATATENISFSPTLDLRMDHMGLPEPNKTLHAEAEAYRVTSSVIFTRGIVHQGDPERPVVRALVNFTPIDVKVLNTPDFSNKQARGNEEGSR